nr:hypothetical protein [Tanacetum cinerariifolium]
MTESPLVDSGFVVPVFSPKDDPIACLNKAMAFLTAVASSRFPSNNNQLKTSSNLRNQATIQDGRARVVKCYNYQGEGHMDRQCTQPKRPRNAAWYKDKAILAEAQEAGKILAEEQLAFLIDPGVLNEIPHSETYLNDTENQNVLAMQDFEQPPAVDFTDNEIHSDSNIIPYSQYLQETQQANVQDTHLQAQQDSMILSVIEQMSTQMINHSQLNANSKPVCATREKSMFDGVHDMCLLDFVKNVNSHAKSAKKHKKQNILKPTSHVFTEVGFKWKPTGRTFTIVGNSYPLTRITLAKVVPPKKPTSHSAKPQKLELKVYSRKPKNIKNVGCPDCSLVSGLWMFETHDMEPLIAHELSSKPESWLWHRRLSHLNFGALNKLAKDGLS